jgi:hypothetical protein
MMRIGFPPDVARGIQRWRFQRRSAERRDPKLFAEVSKVVRRHDPLGLVEMGAPEDEYDNEAAAILMVLGKCTCAQEALDLIHEVFVRWFDTDLAGPKKRYAPLAREIWELWTRHAA